MYLACCSDISIHWRNENGVSCHEWGAKFACGPLFRVSLYDRSAQSEGHGRNSKPKHKTAQVHKQQNGNERVITRGWLLPQTNLT